MVIHIWAGGKFRPGRVRLIGGVFELLRGVGIIGRMRLTVDFGNRNAHAGQGGWGAMGMNSGNRWVFPLVPTARGYTKSEEFFENWKLRFGGV